MLCVWTNVQLLSGGDFAMLSILKGFLLPIGVGLVTSGQDGDEIFDRATEDAHWRRLCLGSAGSGVLRYLSMAILKESVLSPAVAKLISRLTGLIPISVWSVGRQQRFVVMNPPVVQKYPSVRSNKLWDIWKPLDSSSGMLKVMNVVSVHQLVQLRPQRIIRRWASSSGLQQQGNFCRSV